MSRSSLTASASVAAKLDPLSNRCGKLDTPCRLDRLFSQKLTFGELHETGVSEVLVHCTDYKCAHHVTMMTEYWPDRLRFSDIEANFVCQVSGRGGADIRPKFPDAPMGSG